MQHLLRFAIFIIVIQKQKSTGFHKKFLTLIVMRHLWYTLGDFFIFRLISRLSFATILEMLIHFYF